ncbi:unnamed protein product [Peniophora sp. CBMAI 1063]|nr:unnamed protein product [Peniophora sp. CBMAI 1063]
MAYKAWAELVTGERIRVFQEDKGGEFTGKKWDAMYAQTGITFRRTTRNRPEQNGVAERANRTVVEGTAAVLAESGMPHSSTRGQSLKATRYEVWHKQKPDYSHLRVWGCRAYAHVQRDKRDKLQWHIIKGVFIGYPEGYKGWRWHKQKPDYSHLRVWGCRAYAHVQRDKRDKLQWHIIKGVFIGYPEGYKGWRIWDGKKAIICETVVFDERYFPHSKLALSQPMVVDFERPPELTLC